MVIKKTVKKAVKKTVKKTAKKTTKETTKKPAKKAVKKVTKKTTKKIVKKKTKTTKKVSTKKKVMIVVAQPDYKVNEALALTKYETGAHSDAHTYHKDPMQTGEPHSSYNINRVVILPVDPKFAFIYWELRQDTIEGTLSHYKDGSLTLRIYDVTNVDFNGNNAHEWWDIEVYHRIGTWYLKHNRGDRNLMVDICIKTKNGGFHALARSKAIYFPRDNMVGPGKIYWMLVDEFGNKLVSDIEDYTDADMELLKKIMGKDRLRRFMKGGLDIFLGASAWGRIPEIDNFIDLKHVPSSRSGSKQK